jgi:hypothetical protein
MSAAPLFYRLRGSEWRAAGLPGVTQAYALHAAGKLALVKDAAGRTGITAAEAARYFGDVTPLSAGNKRDVRRANSSRRKAA